MRPYSSICKSFSTYRNSQHTYIVVKMHRNKVQNGISSTINKYLTKRKKSKDRNGKVVVEDRDKSEEVN